MNRHQAIQAFFEGFGVDVYADSAVPAQAGFPRITYSYVDGDFLSGETSMLVNVWCYTDSEAEPNELVRRIGNAIGFGGKLLPFDGGALWIKRGSPWAQTVSDEGDNAVKRRYLNVDVEFLTMGD